MPTYLRLAIVACALAGPSNHPAQSQPAGADGLACDRLCREAGGIAEPGSRADRKRGRASSRAEPADDMRLDREAIIRRDERRAAEVLKRNRAIAKSLCSAC